MDRLHRGVRPAGERAQVVALDLAVEEPAGEHQCVEPGLGEVAARQAAALVVEEAEVEGRVVRHQHVLPGELDEARQGVLDVGAAGDHLVVDAGELGDHLRDRPVRVHERDEALDHLAAAHPHCADLGDLREARRPAGGLEVDHAEGRAGQARRRPLRRRQPDQVAPEPGEARVALHDLGHQPPLEPLGAAAQPQQLGGDVPHLERPAPAGDEGAEPVGQRVGPLGPGLGRRERQVELQGGRHRRPMLTATPAVTPRPRRRPGTGARRGRTASRAAPPGGPRRGSSPGPRRSPPRRS